MAEETLKECPIENGKAQTLMVKERNGKHFIKQIRRGINCKDDGRDN